MKEGYQGRRIAAKEWLAAAVWGAWKAACRGHGGERKKERENATVVCGGHVVVHRGGSRWRRGGPGMAPGRLPWEERKRLERRGLGFYVF